MPVSDADGLFKNPLSFVKPLTTPEVNAPSGQFSSVPMPGAVPSMTGGSGGFGSRRGLGKLGSGSSLDVSAPKNTPYAKNLEKINKAGGIDGFDASVSLYNIKARSAEAAQQALQRMNGQQPVQAAQPQFPKDMPEEQQAAPAQVTAGWQTQFKKPDEEGFAESLQQPQEFTAPAPAADTSVGQMVSQTQRGPGESLTLSPTGEKLRTRGYAIASKDIVSTHAPNQYSDDDAEAEAIENEARYISQKIYGVDSDTLAEMTTKQYKDKTFTSRFAAQWQNDLRMLAGFERKMHTADLSNKDIEAWQAAASRLRSNAAMLGLYNAIASAPVMQDASAELQRDVVSAVRNFDEEKIKRYVPQLLSNKTYKRLMDTYQSGDRSVRGSLRALGDLFDSTIAAEKAEEDDVSGWFDFSHWDLLKRNAQTVWNRVSKGLLLTIGDIKDAYYDVRDELAGTPVTDAQKAEAEARKEEQRFNKIAMQLISDDRRTEQDQIDQASDTYRIYERIARSRDIMAGRDSGSIVSAASKFIHSPLTYATSMSADSADSILGIAAAVAVGAVSKTAAVHMIRSNIMRGVGVGLTRGQKLFTTGVGLTGTALVGAESVGVPNASDTADSIANASVDRLVSNGSFVPFAMQDQYRTKSDARIIANRLLQPGGVIEQGLAQQGNPDGQEYYANAVQLGQLISDMHLKAGDAVDSDTPLTEQQIKDFYNNPLVIRNLQENPDSSLLISQYRTHLWGTGYDKTINPQRLVGAGEALAAPLFAGAGISGAAAKGIDNLLSHVIDSPTARSIISKALYAHLEEGGSETIEQIFQNFSGLQAEGREVTWDELSKNLGASFFGGAVLGGVMASPRLAYEGYRAIRSGQQQQPPVGGGNGPANPPAGPTPFSPLTGFTNTVQDPAARDADMRSYNDTVNWYNGLSPDEQRTINGAFDASHIADNPFGAMTRDELDKRVQSIQQVQQHLRDEQQALSSIQDPAKRTEAANRIVQDQREAQRLLNTLNRARQYYTDTGTITGIWQGDKQSDGSIDYISSRTVKRADIDSMRKKFDESTATQETLDILNQLRQRDSTGKTRWALYDNDTLVRYNLSPAAAASGVPVYPRNTKATFIPVKYVHIDSKGVPHFSSVYGQWSDTEKQLFDDFRKKVGKPVSDVRAWRAKDGRMGVRYKLGGNVTAITIDDLAKQYGLNKQPQGQGQTQTQQPQGQTQTQTQTQQPQGQTQTQQPQPQGQGQTQTQQPQPQGQTQTQQPQPQGQTQQPQGQTQTQQPQGQTQTQQPQGQTQTQQPQGQTQTRQPQGQTQTQTQQQKTPFEEMQDNEKNLLEYLNKAAKDLVARTSWGRKQKDDNNCFKGLANTVTNYVKYINRLRQKGPNGQQAITDQQADETLQKVRDAYSNALRTIINGLADRSYSDAAAKAMAYFATENLNSYTDVAESVAAIIRAIDDTRSVYWPSAPTKWDLQFCNTVRGRILGYMGLCMVQSPTALDDYPAEYKAQAQRIADEIKAKKLAVAIYAKDLNNYKSQDAAPQTVDATADYIIRDIDRAATPPKTEEKKTPEPQPETKKTPEPQPETKKTPEPQPETKKTPEPQPETKKTPEPQPETKKTPEPQPETKKTPEPQPEQTKSTKKKAPDYESKSKTFTSIKEKEAQLRALIQQLPDYGNYYQSADDTNLSESELVEEIIILREQLRNEWEKLWAQSSEQFPDLTGEEVRVNKKLLAESPITFSRTYNDDNTVTVGEDLARAHLWIWAMHPRTADKQLRELAFDALDTLVSSASFQEKLHSNTFNFLDIANILWSAAADALKSTRPDFERPQATLQTTLVQASKFLRRKLRARYKAGPDAFKNDAAHNEVLKWIADEETGLGMPLYSEAEHQLSEAAKKEEEKKKKAAARAAKKDAPPTLKGLSKSLNSLAKKRPDIAEKVGSAQNEVSICEKALAEVQKELESHGEDDKTYYENQVKKAQKALEGAQKTLAKKQKALAEIDQKIADKTKQMEELKAKQEAEEKVEKEKAEKEKAEKERAAQEAEEKKKAEQEAAEKKRKENLRRLSAVSRMVPADSNEASQVLINESNRKDFSELKDKTIDLSFTPETETEPDKYGLDLEIGVLIAGGKWTTAVGNILDELSKHGALLNKRLLQGDITRADWVQLLTPYCDRPERLSELRQALICVENIIHAHCQTEWAPEGTIPVNDRKFEEITADPFVQWRKDNGLPLTHNETIAFSEMAKQAEEQKQAEAQKQAEQTPTTDEEKLEATIAECDNRAKDLARQIRDAKAALDKARDAAEKFAIALMDAKGDTKAALQAANDAADAEAEKQYDLYNQLLADNTANEKARAEASAKLDELRKAKETKNGTKPETGSADIGSNSAPQPGAQPEGNTAKEAGQTNSGPADRVNPAAEGTGDGRTGTQNPGAVTGNVPPAQQVRTAGTNPDGHRVPEQSEPAAAQTNNGAGSTAGEGSSGKANGPVENAAGKGAGQSGSGTVNSDPRTWHPDVNAILKPGINNDTYDNSDPYSNLTPEWQEWVRQAAPVLADAIKSGALPFIRGEEAYHYEMRMLEYLGVAEVNDLPGVQAVAISESFNRILDREYNVETLRTKNNHDLDELITGIQRENKSSIGENKPETKPAASPQIKHEAADRFNREQLVAKFESAANSLYGDGAAEFDKLRKYIRDSLEGKFSGVFAGLYPTGMDKATEQRDLDEMADKITMAILPVLLPVYNMFSLQGWKFEFYIEPRLVKGLGAFNFRPTEKLAYIAINLGKLASADVNLKSLTGLHMDKAARAEAAKNLIPLEVASCVWHEALHALHYITGTKKTSIKSLNMLADAVSALVDPELIKQFKAKGLRDTDIYVETVSTAIEMLVLHANLTTNGESYAARLLGQLIADAAKYAATPEYQQLPVMKPSVHSQAANWAQTVIKHGHKFIRDRAETVSPNTPPIAAYEHMLRQLWGLAYASAPYHPEGARLLKTLSNVLDVMTGDQQLDNALVLLYGRLRGAVTYDGLSMQDVKTRYILTTWSRKYWQILQERCRQHKSGEAVVKEVVMDLADLTGLSENELFQIVPYDDLLGQIRADIGKIGMSRDFLAQLDESNMSALNLKDMIDAAQAAAQSAANGNSAQSKTNVNKPEQKPQPKSESKSEPQTKNIKAKEQTPDGSTKAEAENLKRKLDNTPTAEAVETKTNPTQQETAETKAKLDVAGTTNQPEKPKPAQPDTAEAKDRARNISADEARVRIANGPKPNIADTLNGIIRSPANPERWKLFSKEIQEQLNDNIRQFIERYGDDLQTAILDGAVSDKDLDILARVILVRYGLYNIKEVDRPEGKDNLLSMLRVELRESIVGYGDYMVPLWLYLRLTYKQGSAPLEEQMKSWDESAAKSIAAIHKYDLKENKDKRLARYQAEKDEEDHKEHEAAQAKYIAESIEKSPYNAEFNKARARTKFKPVLSYYPTDSAEGDAVVSLDGKPFSYDFTVKKKSFDQRLVAVKFQVNEFDKAAHDEDNVFVFDTAQPFDLKKPFIARIDGSQNSSLSTIGGNAKRGGNIMSDESMNGLLEWVKWFHAQGNAIDAIHFLQDYLKLIANGTPKALLQIRASGSPNAPFWYIPVTTKVQKATDLKKYFLDKITISNNDRETIKNFTPYAEGMLKAMINLARTIQNAKTGARNQGKFFTPVIIYPGQEQGMGYTQALVIGHTYESGPTLFNNLFTDGSKTERREEELGLPKQITETKTSDTQTPEQPKKKNWAEDILGQLSEKDAADLAKLAGSLSIEPSEADDYMESADDPELPAEGEFDAVSPQPSAPDFNVDDSDDFDTGDSDIDTDTPLDDGSWDIYGLNTPADVQRYAGLWAALTAKVTQAVKRTALHRRAQQQQTKDSLNMNNMFYENRVTRAVVKHLISNWDKSDAELRLWVRENFQGEIDPDDNFITQAIVLARRNVGVMLDLSAQILQYGVTANEDGELVHIQDENGNAVESVFQLTKRWLNTLRKNKVRTDTVGELIDYRNDMGMFRTLMHTFEANEMLHRRMIEQYQALEQQINDVMSTSNDAKKLKELTKQHDALADKIRDFENLMQVTDLADTDIKSVVPAGGRTNAMAKAQLDELYHKYYDALLKGGMSHDEAQAMMQQMIGEFNTAYTVAIGELDKVTAMYGLVSEQELNERHAGFNYYTPLRASVGSGVGSIHKESEGSTHEARDAIYNFAAQALRVAETAGDNEIGTALFDAYNTLAQQYKTNMATGDPATIMKVISHKVFDLKGRGGIYSFNGLLVIDSDTLSSIEATYKDDTTQTRIGNFRKSAIVIDLVDTVNDNELKNGETAETVTRKVWVGFDPDPIGRAGKVYPESDAQLEGREENGGIGNCYIGANGELVAPKVEVRDYRGVGEALTSIYGQNHEKAGKFMRACGMLTRAVSECMTTFNPLFAPKASVRDIFERGQYCVRHQFTAADGSTVNGVTVMLRMWKNLLMNPAFLIQGASASMNIAHHKESRNKSRYAKYVNEMYRRGLLGNMQQQYVANGDTRADIYGPTALDKVKARVAEGDADSITKRYYKMLHKAVPYSKIGLVGRFCKFLHQKALGWANFFYNASLAAQYVALRESGCSVDTAAAATANAMDFANQGKYAKYGTKMFSFFNSIMHGSANYFDSWGLNANATSANPNLKRTHYYRRMLGRSITAKGIRLAAMLGLVQIVTAAMGAFCRPDDPEDDLVKGQRLLDTTPLRNMTFLPLPLLQMLGISDKDGIVAKLVGGFGEDAQAMNFAWGIDRLSRGKATGAEVFGSLAVNLVTNTTPFEAPAADAGSNPFRYIGYTAVKANPVGSLIADALFNMTYSGHSLVSDYDQQFGMRAYQTRDPYTEVRSKEISEWLYKHTGGMLDISPKIIQSIANGAGFGPIVSAGRDLLMHIGDEVPKSELDPNWDTAHVNAGMKAFGVTSLGNKFPEMPGLFTSQQIKYWDGVFTKLGVGELMKADPGKKNKVDKIQATMRAKNFSEEEVIDYVNLWGVQQEMKKIHASMNDLYDEFHRGDIDSDQYIDGMQELHQQAYDLQYDYMKNSYYYRGVYDKRTDFDEDALAEVRSQVEGEE